MNNQIKIGHYADIQVIAREKNLGNSYEHNLSNIENIIINQELDVVVIAGDFFEHDEQNHLETKIMYNHLARLLKIPTLKELVLMVGNHDLAKDRKQLEATKGTNAIDTFVSLIDKFGLSSYIGKLVYLKEQRQYISPNIENLAYIAYSLEDGFSNGNNINPELIDRSYYNICIFHDILKEYVDEAKLPVKKSTYDKLMSIEHFQSNLILAGDIHQLWHKTNLDENKNFYYPGSTLERNFGEGGYIKIRKNSVIDNAARKYMLIHTIDTNSLDNKSHQVKQEMLESFVNHITIDINSNVMIDDLNDKIIAGLGNMNFGKDITFIKLKLSNLFISQELSIFNAITDYCNVINSPIEIQFKYDKIIAHNTVANNMLSNQLLVQNINPDDPNNPEQEIIEITIDNVAENFDNIVLTEDKLVQLFQLQLDTNKPALLKELGDVVLLDNVYSDILNLFKEQIQMTIGSNPNFSVDLLKLSTNGFMRLDATSVDLDIPGLTRITGTNGIGKSTLYNMMRWVIDDLLFEGLKSNQKINNALLVFNDTNINKDDVIVELKATVNNTPVTITRWVKRKWKTNISNEQKLAPDWKKHISECTRGIKLEVFSEKNGITVKTGDEAENIIKKWFANTANTILILNQHKILTMLNLPSNELRQLVLDYIGVDYLYALDNNLESIKASYNLQRPKRNKKELQDLINEIKTTSDSDAIQFEKLTESLSETKSLFDAKSNEQSIIDNQLRDLGNIPSFIISTENDISTKKDLISKFEHKELQDIPTFTDIMPSVDDFKNHNYLSSSELTLTLNDNKKELLDNNVIIEDTNKLISNEYNSLYDAIGVDISKLETALKDNLTKHENDYIVLVDNIKLTIENCKQVITDAISIEQQKVNIIIENKKSERLSAVTEIGTLKVRNNKLVTEIADGCCGECKRILDDFDTKHAELKQAEINTNLTKINNLNIVANNCNIEIDKQTTELKSLNDYQTNISYNRLQQMDSDKFVERFKKYQGVIDAFVDFHDNTTLLEHFIYTLNQIRIKNLEYLTVEMKEPLPQKIDWKLNDLKMVQNLIQKRDFENIAKQNLNAEKFNQPASIASLTAAISILIETNTILQNDINSLQTDIDDIILKYNNALAEYRKKQEQYTIDLNSTIKFNQDVETHNSSYTKEVNILELLEHQLIEHQENLVNYNSLVDDYNLITIALKELNNIIQQSTISINEMTIRIASTESQLELLNTEYEAYLKYQQDTIIFNMYSKIIKKDFKDSVFGYYREFLNITLNLLLDEVDFKLFWLETGDLFYYEVSNGSEIYRPVQMVSGMETCFLGLSLIYAIHTLNVKNNISHLFIDEISGQLNSGKELVNKDNAVDYQEKLILLLSKFKDKKIFIVDHVIKNLYQTKTYEVIKGENGSKYIDLD